MFPIIQQTDFTGFIALIVFCIFLGLYFWIGIANEKEQEKINAIIQKKKDDYQEKIIKERQKELYKKQQEHIEELKKRPNIWNADKLLGKKLEILSNELTICNKCDSNRFRFWNFTNTYLEVKCLGCRKNQGLNLKESDELKELFDIYNNYVELDNEADSNPYIRLIDHYDEGLKIRSNDELYRRIFINGFKKSIGDNTERNDERSRRITQDVMDRVWRRDEGKCVECGSNENLEFDHIIPFSKGGANTYRNIQLLCEPCNRKKLDKIG